MVWKDEKWNASLWENKRNFEFSFDKDMVCRNEKGHVEVDNCCGNYSVYVKRNFEFVCDTYHYFSFKPIPFYTLFIQTDSPYQLTLALLAAVRTELSIFCVLKIKTCPG